MTPADDLLLRLLRWDWDPAPCLPATVGHETDWAKIVQTALDHGVAGLLCRSLRRLPAGEVPQDVVDAAGVYLASADAQGATLVAQLLEILDVLAAAGIPALPFKGPVLGILAHGSATIRPSWDIDVLVHRPDMDRAVATLRRLGYRPGESWSPRVLAAYYDYNGQVALFAEGRVPIEPHCAFLRRALDVNLDMNGVWERARPLDLAGRVVLSLSLEDTLFAACLHGCKDEWYRLRRVADVAAFVHRHPTLDWVALMERAKAAGGQRMLLLGLALAQDLFAAPLPVAISSAIERDKACVRLVRQRKSLMFGPVAALGSVHRVARFHLRSRDRIWDRIRYAWRTVMTPRVIHYRMVKLPDSLFFGYVVVKLVHDYLLLPVWNIGKSRWWRRTPNSITDVTA